MRVAALFALGLALPVAKASSDAFCGAYPAALATNPRGLVDTGESIDGVPGATFLDTTNSPDTTDRDGNDRGNNRDNRGTKVQTQYLAHKGIPDDQESALWDLFLTAEDETDLHGPNGVVSASHNTTLCCGSFRRRENTNDDRWSWHEHADTSGVASADYSWTTWSPLKHVVYVAHDDGGVQDGRLFDGSPSTGCESWDSSSETWADRDEGCGAFLIECDPNTGAIVEIDLEQASLGTVRSEVVPNSIGTLTSLTKLDMASNRWTGMSSNIQHLDALTILDMHDNNLHMPASIVFNALAQVGPASAPHSTLVEVNFASNR